MWSSSGQVDFSPNYSLAPWFWIPLSCPGPPGPLRTAVSLRICNSSHWSNEFTCKHQMWNKWLLGCETAKKRTLLEYRRRTKPLAILPKLVHTVKNHPNFSHRDIETQTMIFDQLGKLLKASSREHALFLYEYSVFHYMRTLTDTLFSILAIF